MYETITKNIIRYFHYETDRLYLLVDKSYTELAKRIKQLHEPTEIRLISIDETAPLKTASHIPDEAAVLLLAEPETYVRYKLFQYLDFNKGEPQIPGTSSRVLIFPKESIFRILSGDMDKDITEKERLLTTMKDNQKYRITTVKGTDLVFESRTWIPLDFEVCTAPLSLL